MSDGVEWHVIKQYGRSYKYCLLPGTADRNRIIIPYFDGAELLTQEELNSACDHAYCTYKILGDTSVEIEFWDGSCKLRTPLEWVCG